MPNVCRLASSASRLSRSGPVGLACGSGAVTGDSCSEAGGTGAAASFPASLRSVPVAEAGVDLLWAFSFATAGAGLAELPDGL